MLKQIADRLHFSAVSIPDSPWDCLYTLPSEDRLKLATLLRRAQPDFYVVASSGGYIGMPGNYDGYDEFCLSGGELYLPVDWRTFFAL